MFLLSRIIFALFIFTSCLALYEVHRISSHDPTSLFFNPKTAYTLGYSALRRQQAEEFVARAVDGAGAGATSSKPKSNLESSSNTDANANANTNVESGGIRDPNPFKKLCVGIPSSVDTGKDFLRPAVGSLLAGLSPEERSEIHLIIFIPSSTPTTHPSYSESWLPALADEVLAYDVPDDQVDRVTQLEHDEKLAAEKKLYDYGYLVKKCYRQDVPYIAVIEDDTLAMHGWYHRTLAAIERAEMLSALNKESPDFLYLRLFYTESFLGWNKEEFRTYFFYGSIAVVLPGLFLAATRLLSPLLKRLVTAKAILYTVPISVFCVAAFFALGRATVLPLSVGVHEMPKFGCCSQGLVFPREKALVLVRYFEEHRNKDKNDNGGGSSVERLTEKYADENAELRWALTPSVLQHVGRKRGGTEGKGLKGLYGREGEEWIWSFGFERYGVQGLEMEHEWVEKRREEEAAGGIE